MLLSCGCDQNGRCHIPHIKERSLLGGEDKGWLTCWQREGEQVRQEVAGKVSFALVQRGGDLPADLLRHLGTYHGGDALGRLLAHLRERRPGQGSLQVAGTYVNKSHQSGETGLNFWKLWLVLPRGRWTNFKHRRRYNCSQLQRCRIFFSLTHKPNPCKPK